MTQAKVLTPAAALKKIRTLQRNGKRVVFTNGVFDLLHTGHVTYLEKARKLGDFLIVALNTDASVRRLGKGPDRPVNPLKARARVMAALECVGAVTSFSEDTPLNLIRKLCPDVLVKGGDYALSQIVGAREVLARGGKVKSIPLVSGFSTTGILKKARRA